MLCSLLIQDKKLKNDYNLASNNSINTIRNNIQSNSNYALVIGITFYDLASTSRTFF